VLPGGDRVIGVWAAATAKELRQITGHSGPVFQLAATPDGKRLASFALDGTASVWDASSGKELCRIRPGGPGTIGQLFLTPDGKTVLSSVGNQVVVYDVETGEDRHPIPCF